MESKYRSLLCQIKVCLWFTLIMPQVPQPRHAVNWITSIPCGFVHNILIHNETNILE
jgi:hypothetical protein